MKSKLLREIRTCICGCKESFECKINSKQKFINGHNAKLMIHKKTCKCFACRNKRKEDHNLRCNCMACEMIRGKYKGKNHPFYGKHHTEETCLKMKFNHKNFSMENHPQWKKGKSYELYGIECTDEFRESIRKRDNYKCQLCGKKQNDRLLDTHHIDYIKRNNNSNNLITLCNKCHTKTNFNKNYWKNFLENKRIL